MVYTTEHASNCSTLHYTRANPITSRYPAQQSAQCHEDSYGISHPALLGFNPPSDSFMNGINKLRRPFSRLHFTSQGGESTLAGIYMGLVCSVASTAKCPQCADSVCTTLISRYHLSAEVHGEMSGRRCSVFVKTFDQTQSNLAFPLGRGCNLVLYCVCRPPMSYAPAPRQTRLMEVHLLHTTTSPMLLKDHPWQTTLNCLHLYSSPSHIKHM